MAFPTVVGTSSLSLTNNTAVHQVPYPTVSGGIQAGDLLLAIGTIDSLTGTNSITDWGGFTELRAGVASAGNPRANAECGYKWATGGETGTADFTPAATEHGSWLMYVIRGADAAGAPEASTGGSGSSATAEPDALAPSWGSDDTLWLAVASLDAVAVASAAPANYTNLLQVTGDSSGAGVAVAQRELTAATENPGAFTIDTEQWFAYTIGVKPAGAPAGTPVSATRALAYQRENVVSATRALAYGRQAAVSATRALTYQRMNAVGAQRALSYQRLAAVGASRKLAYERLGPATATRALAYDRTGTVSTTRALAYERVEAVAAERALAYERVSRVSSTRALSYARSAPVGARRRVVYARGAVSASVPSIVMKKNFDQRAFDIRPIGRRR